MRSAAAKKRSFDLSLSNRIGIIYELVRSWSVVAARGLHGSVGCTARRLHGSHAKHGKVAIAFMGRICLKGAVAFSD